MQNWKEKLGNKIHRVRVSTPQLAACKYVRICDPSVPTVTYAVTVAELPKSSFHEHRETYLRVPTAQLTRLKLESGIVLLG